MRSRVPQDFNELEYENGQCVVSVLIYNDSDDMRKKYDQTIILIEDIAKNESGNFDSAFKCCIYKDGLNICIRYFELNQQFIAFKDLLPQLPIGNYLYSTSKICNENDLQIMLKRFEMPQRNTNSRWAMSYLRMLGPGFQCERIFYEDELGSGLFLCDAAFFKKASDTICIPAVAISTISCAIFLLLIFYLQNSSSIDDNSFSFNGSM